MSNTLKTRSGATIREISRNEANEKKYLTRDMLFRMHLIPTGDPAAFFDPYKDDTAAEDTTDKSASDIPGMLYFFNPENVAEAPAELWYFPDDKPAQSMTLPSGSRIYRMSTKRAAICGYYTPERLSQMNCVPREEPVAYTVRQDGTPVFFYDKKTAERLPLPCIRCGNDVRYKKKLCRACFEAEMAEKRAEGDARRNAEYHMKRERVLFFDLELTGFYDHDEIISISIVDGTGKTVMNTLVRPIHKKKWKQTEKIHGITPDMVADAPTLEELTPEIKEIFTGADNLIAYGVSTDYSHIKAIYETEAEQRALHDKVRCCANEFVHYAQEHRPDVQHASLTDAMATLAISWDGIAHTSMADTVACRKVWDALFPHYYDN